MAHFAKLDDNNTVTQVVLVGTADICDDSGNVSEEIGVSLCKNLYGGDNWKQTSEDNSIRIRFANVGHVYNQELDAFIPPKPYKSWILNNETFDWEAPTGPAPTLTEAEVKSRSFYRWNENTKQWVLETPPTYPELTPQQKLEAAGLTIEELKSLLEL